MICRSLQPLVHAAWLAALIVGLCAAAQGAEIGLDSPSGNLSVGVYTAQGKVYYALYRHDTPLLDPSPIGIKVNGFDLGSSVTAITATAPTELNESYPYRGSRSTATNHYRECFVQVQRSGPGNLTYTIILRLFDDGFAFRYVIPGVGNRVVGGETSGWALPAGARVWYMQDTSNYEGFFIDSEIGQFADSFASPLTVRLPGTAGYLMLTEAQLRNYSGMTYRSQLGSRVIQAEFLDDISWIVAGGKTSPWRVVMAGESLDSLMQSTLIANLNDAPDPALFPDTSWIKPGRALWPWFIDFFASADYNLQIQYIDAAHQLGFEYVTIDAGWEEGFPTQTASAFERLGDLVQYARADGRQVGIFVWKNWNQLFDPVEREYFFETLAQLGVAGVKIDNIDDPQFSESFSSIALIEAILTDAAHHKLMIDFHGCTKNSGLARTFPNEITREGLLGMEYNSILWQYGLFLPANYLTTLPFTRFLAGPGDFTPFTLDPRRMGSTTFGMQIATIGLFPSALMHYGVEPPDLLGNPSALDFVKAIPPIWDESHALPPSEIGSLAAIARRKGNDWFLFVANGDSATTRTLNNLGLSFLGTGAYNADLLSDDTSTTLNRQTSDSVTGNDKLNIPLLPGGGFVAIFRALADRDHDGVIDSADAAPDDPSVSRVQNFYRDADGDQAGDAAAIISLAATKPYPGFVAVGNDPDDQNISNWPAPLDRGGRLLGVSFLGNNATAALQSARRIGAQFTHLRLRWSDVETAPGVYSAAVVDQLQSVRNRLTGQSLSLLLTVKAIDGELLTVPADLAAGLKSGAISMADAALVQRFENMLDFIRGNLTGVPILAVQIGEDINRLQAPTASFWDDYRQLLAATAQHIHAQWEASIGVGAAAEAESLISLPMRDVLKNVNGAADFVGVSLLPGRRTGWAPLPESIPLQISQLVSFYPGRRLYFSSLGLPALPAAGGSITLQAQFIATFFDSWDKNADSIPLACFEGLEPAAESLPPLASSLLVDGDYDTGLNLMTAANSLIPQPGFQVLRDQAFNRGWWNLPPRGARSFLMGFTAQPYDQQFGQPPQLSVLNQIYGQMRTDADMVVHQYDHGVPWTEALVDNLSGPLPYSNQVRNTWTNDVSLRPAHRPVAVAINPLGIPRRLLAAYWGVGEGFYHDNSFNRVGNGIVADFEDRMLPNPWNSLAFNSTQVKAAYLAYCKRVIKQLKPDFLITAIEANLVLQDEPAKFNAYVDLQKYIYQNLKADPETAGVKIVVSLAAEYFLLDDYGLSYQVDGLQSPGLEDRHLLALTQLLPWMDVVGLSVYPIKTKYNANWIPADMLEKLFGTLAALTDKPLAITETGYPTSSFSVGGIPYNPSVPAQGRYFNLLFEEAQRSGRVAFVVNFLLRDADRAMDNLRAASLTDPPGINPQLVDFFQFFEHIGLYGATGRPQPGAQSWLNELAVPYSGDFAPWNASRYWSEYQ